MGKEIIVVSNVRGYIKDEVAYLNIEDVARGLGFTTVAASGNEVVRWNTVYGYLVSLNAVATSCNGNYRDACPDFIPENIFYRLAMKAKNETAEKFQALVADEILPSIRKHGAYMTDNVLEQAIANPDFMIGLLQNLKEEQKKRVEAEAKVEELKPKALFADAVETSQRSCLVAELAKILKQNGVDTGQNRLFKWLRENGYLGNKGEYYNQPTQKAMDMGLFELKKRTVNNPDGTVMVVTTTKVTPKGQIYFVNKLIEK